LRLCLQLSEVICLGDLGYLAGLPGFAQLDAEFPYLLFQALLTGINLARHALEDARQLPQSISTSGDVRQVFWLKLSSLNSRRGGGDMGYIPQILHFLVT
jgi:hypothetical protein